MRSEPGDIDIVSKPNLWPGLLLPVKRRGQRLPEIGFLTGEGPFVYLGNVFDPAEGFNKPPIVYSDFKALLEDGWEVD